MDTNTKHKELQGATQESMLDFDRSMILSFEDPIACICATEQCLLVARESGVVQRYSLPMTQSFEWILPRYDSS